MPRRWSGAWWEHSDDFKVNILFSGFQGVNVISYKLTWENLGKHLVNDTGGEHLDKRCFACVVETQECLRWVEIGWVSDSHQTSSLVEKTQVGEPRLKPAWHPRTPHSA